VGIVGGGQLARMSAAPAAALGIGLRVLAAAPDESAAQVIRDVAIGRHDDLDALLRFADGCDVVTFDHEHVPPAHLEQLEARGIAVRPGPSALFHAQDKVHMRQALTDIGVQCPRWRVVTAVDHVVDFADEVGWPVVVKTSRGGYDGRGVWVVESKQQAAEVLAVPLVSGAQWLAEERIDFVQELSAQVARSPHGQAVAYPVVRTVQANGICAEVVAPAPGLAAERAVAAQEIALRVARDLNVTGMLAVEMFDDGFDLYVNELAMRPHNSGHWSIEGARTSQFENHLRAVLDLPLGEPAALAPYAVMVNILGGDMGDLHSAYRHVLARDPGLKVHLYGKAVRPGRKVGHVTVMGDDLEGLLARGRHAADYFAGVIDE
jgi:5-(carboxyamino)imidazole ribonucleotide synthase